MLVVQFIIGFILGVIIFLGGLHFYAKYASYEKTSRCPNILIQVGSKYFLLNSNIERVPGVNPLEFATLEDYHEFLKWQKTVGIKCPVLFVQKTYDAQGNRVYKMRPSVNEQKGGLPPTPPSYVSADKPNIAIINESTCGKPTIDVSGADPHSSIKYSLWELFTGSNTSSSTNSISKIDANGNVVHSGATPKIEFPADLTPCPVPEFKTLSDDPMDTNWGGEDYTEKSVKSGKYKGSEV
jgi:hypothetical protein